MFHIEFEEFQEYIKDISDHAAFELAEVEGGYVVPYIMNDSIEDWFFLENCRLMGDFDPDFEGAVVEAIREQDLKGLLIRQGDRVTTLWFDRVCRERKVYRYDEIGHFWQLKYEHWRRIVYMMGTLYDKFTYGGEEFLNDEEKYLLPLMEFAPLREYALFRDSVHGYYPDTYAGINVVRELAMEVGDTEFVRLLMGYEKHPSYRRARYLAKKMNSVKRAPLYGNIYRHIASASSKHPSRDYGAERNGKIAELRTETERKLLQAGYEGKYPLFVRGNVQVLAAEEHPFTLREMEYKDFDFSISFMVSECKKPPKYLCQGFFDGGGKSYIVKDLDELL